MASHNGHFHNPTPGSLRSIGVIFMGLAKRIDSLSWVDNWSKLVQSVQFLDIRRRLRSVEVAQTLQREGADESLFWTITATLTTEH